MTTKIEMLELLSKMKNCIAVYDLDRDNSEFENEPGVMAKFRSAIPVLEKTYPLIATIEDLLYGDTTPLIFNKTWSSVYAMAQTEAEITPAMIGSEVTSFLKKASKVKAPRKTKRDGREGDTT